MSSHRYTKTIDGLPNDRTVWLVEVDPLDASITLAVFVDGKGKWMLLDAAETDRLIARLQEARKEIEPGRLAKLFARVTSWL